MRKTRLLIGLVIRTSADVVICGFLDT